MRSGHAGLNPTPVTGAPVLPVALLPSSSTEGMTNYGSLSLGANSSRTIQPGIYTKISVSGNARLTMAPGIYIIKLTDALGNSVSASSLPVVSVSAAVSAGTLVSQSAPEASHPDSLFTFDPTSGSSRFNLRTKGVQVGLVRFSDGR